MKLTVGTRLPQDGFALPAILLISTVMIAILVASIGAAAASRVALDSQYYNQLARLAAESGVARANECLGSGGYTPQWSTKVSGKDLRPDTDCTGSAAFSDRNALGPTTSTPIVQTTYSVDAPSGAGIGANLKVTGTTELLRSSTLGDGSRDVWRRYEYVTYLRNEPPESIGCPDGYIAVPGNPTFQTTDFCVMKYEAKSVNGRAASVPGGAPYVRISQEEAILASKVACDGCHLITEAEWLTIAHNLLNVNSNWTGGTVGVGELYRGHSDNAPDSAQEASPDDADGYFGTENGSGNQRRTMILSNGEVIWDFSGNLWEYTSAQINGGQPGPSGWAWREWNAITATPGYAATPSAPLFSPFPSFGTPAASAWNGARGLGRLYSSGSDTGVKAFLRSGSWFDASGYGIFSLALNRAPTFNTQSDVTFRVVR